MVAGAHSKCRREDFGARIVSEAGWSASGLRRSTNIKGLLFAQGVRGINIKSRYKTLAVDQLATGDGYRLPPRLVCEVAREIERLAMVQEQIAKIERERDRRRTPCEATERKRRLLLRLKSIGPAISALLSREGRLPPIRQPAAGGKLFGPHPKPLQQRRGGACQGISRAGKWRRAGHYDRRPHGCGSGISRRAHSPDGFLERTAGQSTRMRKTMIVAVARKLRLPFGVTSSTVWCHRARSSTHQRRGTQDNRLTVSMLLQVSVGRVGCVAGETHPDLAADLPL